MEKSLNTQIEGLQLDLEELEKFISSSTRSNVKRQLEEHKITIKSQLNTENKKLENFKITSENSPVTPSSTQTIPKNNTICESITKYAFLSEEKFVK